MLTNTLWKGAWTLSAAYMPLAGHTNQIGGHPLGGKGSKLNDTSGTVDFLIPLIGDFFIWIKIIILYNSFKEVSKMGIKEDLREKYFDIRQNLSDEYLEEKSKLITDKLDKYVKEKQFNNIMIFVSFRNEINTHPLIKKWLKDKDKNIFVPYIDNNLDKMKISKIKDFHQDLSPGVFDILEPIEELQKDDSANYLDLIVVPGLIFSKQGYRIGYGGGYYDMFLNETEPEVKKVGIVFSRFIVNELPVDDHDLPVDLIITEEDIIEAIQSLPDSYRTVFNLFVIEGMTHGEISKILNVSEGTSKSNLSKARIKLQEILKKDELKARYA